MSKNKIVVYTAITGGYDKLKEPQVISKECDYICFTDNENMKSKHWEARKIHYPCKNSTKTARKYKILPHLYLSEYEYSIWIDGSMLIIGDLEKFLREELGDAKMAFFKHRGRNCIYSEARICKIMKRDNPMLITEQMNKYKLEGFPKNQGLIESGVIIRRHNEKEVKKVMDEW